VSLPPLRSAALALAFVGCAAAQAQPPERDLLARVLTAPPSWQVLALGAPPTGAAVAGWGDPGRGCYAIAVTATSPRQNPEDALAGFARALAASAELDGWTTTGSDGVGRLRRGELSGQLRAQAVAIGAGAAVVALACVHNGRAPEACAATCQPVLASFEPAKVAAEVVP
jgi:hypothetical protein